VTEDSHRPSPKGQQRFEQVLALSRLLVYIPVVFLLLDAAASFVYGTDVLIRTAGAFGGDQPTSRVGGTIGRFLIVMDAFLVGATFMIAAFGFYELFICRDGREGRRYWLPEWLTMHDLEDLKARVVSMLILVAAITFVDNAVETHDERSTFYLGLGIALVIVALTAFLRWGRHAEAATAPDQSDAPGDSS
jgi:uncharacterized membrane protein YqhA